ncbi:MAG: 50S ribosomal protein L15 [Deltaproteobacteria bacterium]|nr:50S ribosomal protein L15 [Deltaproteobacteria bacterium]
MLDRLKAPKGATKKIKRVGRGEGSGWGKTSGRGHKGQRSRSGGGVRPGFEGGQMPLHRRLPKRGFTNIFRTEYSVVNVGRLNELFKDGETITKDILKARGLIKGHDVLVKILGNGEISIALTVTADLFSESAKKKIESAGGKAEAL